MLSDTQAQHLRLETPPAGAPDVLDERETLFRGVHLWRTHLQLGVLHAKARTLIITTDRITVCVASGKCTKQMWPNPHCFEFD